MWNKFTLGQKVLRYDPVIYYSTEESKHDNHSVIIKIRLRQAKKPFSRYQYRLSHWNPRIYDTPNGKYLEDMGWFEENKLFPYQPYDPNDILKELCSK